MVRLLPPDDDDDDDDDDNNNDDDDVRIKYVGLGAPPAKRGDTFAPPKSSLAFVTQELVEVLGTGWGTNRWQFAFKASAKRVWTRTHDVLNVCFVLLSASRESMQHSAQCYRSVSQCTQAATSWPRACPQRGPAFQ
eukprot:1999108-Amphidinium_carterae.1